MMRHHAEATTHHERLRSQQREALRQADQSFDALLHNAFAT